MDDLVRVIQSSLVFFSGEITVGTPPSARVGNELSSGGALEPSENGILSGHLE